SPFLFLHLLPTPRSPLFPYTTLFRSHHFDDERLPHRDVERARKAEEGREQQHLPDRDDASPNEDRDGKCLDHERHLHEDDDATRSESTRLNSSHVAISYAVFCLKKKN